MYAPYHLEAVDHATLAIGDPLFVPSHCPDDMAKPTRIAKRLNSRSSRPTQEHTLSQVPRSTKRPRFERSLAPSPSPPPSPYPPLLSPSSPPPASHKTTSPPPSPPPQQQQPHTPQSHHAPGPHQQSQQLYNATPLTTILNHPIYGPLPATPVDPRELSRREVAFHTLYPGNRGYEIAEAMVLVRRGARGRVGSVDDVSPRSLSPERGVGLGETAQGMGVGEGKRKGGKEVWGEDVGDDGGEGQDLGDDGGVGREEAEGERRMRLDVVPVVGGCGADEDLEMGF